MTTPNAVVGTPHYMSPEAFHGATASPATDVYALGVLLYELVTGHPPYLSDSIPDLMRRHLEGNPVRRPGIPGPIWDVIMACMEQKPRLRPTAAEVVADLSDAARRFADIPALPAPSYESLLDQPSRRPEPILQPAVDPVRSQPLLPPAPASIVPAPRRPSPSRRNAAPAWRWVLTAAAGAMVAVTAWNLGRADDGPRDLAAPQVVTVTPSTIARTQPPATPGPSAAAPAGRPAARSMPGGRARPVISPSRVASAHADPAPAPRSTEPKPRPRPTRKPRPRPTRKPQTEARPYGPWECNQSFAVDMASRTGLLAKPCRMTGRDIRYQASLTGAAGARGRMTVALRDNSTGRAVGHPETCDNLVFEGERLATRSCGPGAAKPVRGRTYAVVVFFSYERGGRTLSGESRGETFTW